MPRVAGTRLPQGESPLPSAPSRVALLEAEHARVMAETAGLRAQIARLKKLLWREAMRHRRAHRYGNAKDIEASLQTMETE
jgi:hypothetical protein